MRHLIPVLFAGLLASAAAEAASPIGRVTEVSGAAMAGPDRVASGYALQPGARLLADRGAEVTLRMADDSLVFLQGGSDLLIEKFAFTPVDGRPAAASSSYILYQGTARLVPGALARKSPNTVTVNTVMGDLVASASDFTAGICGVGCADAKGLYIHVKSGEVAFTGAGSATIISAGQTAFIPEGTAVVEVVARTPVFMVALVDNSLTASLDFREPDTLHLRLDAQDFLAGVIDPPASPSQPVASIAR